MQCKPPFIRSEQKGLPLEERETAEFEPAYHRMLRIRQGI